MSTNYKAIAKKLKFEGRAFINGKYVDAIDGEKFEVSPDPIINAQGKWILIEGTNSWELTISSNGGSLKTDSKSIKLANYNLDQDRIRFSIETDTLIQSGVTRIKKKQIKNQLLTLECLLKKA